MWEPFYVKNDAGSWGLSWLIALAGYWMMPLLFWVAGSAGRYSLESRSDRQYIGERVSRLLVPLIAGVLLVVPPQGYYALKMRGVEPGGYFDFLRGYFPDFSDLSGYTGSFSPAHLWFILYLFVFSLLALPLFRWLMRRRDSAAVRKAVRWLSRPPVFAALFLPLAALLALPAPGGQNSFYYFFIYVIGFLACLHPDFDGMLSKSRFPALLALAVTIPAHLRMQQRFHAAPDFSAMDIGLTLLGTLNVWLALIVVLGYGSRLLSFRHRLLDYANEAAFPIYVIHQTVIVAIGYYVVQREWNVWAKFAVILLGSFALSILLYEGVIRRIPALRWLFGIKRPRRG